MDAETYAKFLSRHAAAVEATEEYVAGLVTTIYFVRETMTDADIAAMLHPPTGPNLRELIRRQRDAHRAAAALLSQIEDSIEVRAAKQ